MGIIDAFSKEDRVEITISQLYALMKEAARADLFRNGVKNKVPYRDILCMMDGCADALVPDNTDLIWHDAKTDPPKTPGAYYGKKDDTNSMWLCDYRDGKWTLSAGGHEMKILQWADYTAFSSGDE